MIKKIADAIRLYNFGIFRIYLNKLLPDHIQSQKFLLYRHDLKNLDLRKVKEGIEFIKVEEAGDPVFAKFQERFPAKVFKDRLQDPDRICYVALKNGEVAGYGWVASGHLFLENVNHDFPLNEDECFIYSCYVSKASRGLGIYPAMLNKMLSDCKEKGYRNVFIGVSSSNKGSIRGIEKAGFTFSKRIGYLKMGKFQWWKNENSEASHLNQSAKPA